MSGIRRRTKPIPAPIIPTGIKFEDESKPDIHRFSPRIPASSIRVPESRISDSGRPIMGFARPNPSNTPDCTDYNYKCNNAECTATARIGDVDGFQTCLECGTVQNAHVFDDGFVPQEMKDIDIRSDTIPILQEMLAHHGGKELLMGSTTYDRKMDSFSLFGVTSAPRSNRFTEAQMSGPKSVQDTINRRLADGLKLIDRYAHAFGVPPNLHPKLKRDANKYLLQVARAETGRILHHIASYHLFSHRPEEYKEMRGLELMDEELQKQIESLNHYVDRKVHATTKTGFRKTLSTLTEHVKNKIKGKSVVDLQKEIEQSRQEVDLYEFEPQCFTSRVQLDQSYLLSLYRIAEVVNVTPQEMYDIMWRSSYEKKSRFESNDFGVLKDVFLNAKQTLEQWIEQLDWDVVTEQKIVKAFESSARIGTIYRLEEVAIVALCHSAEDLGCDIQLPKALAGISQKKRASAPPITSNRTLTAPAPVVRKALSRFTQSIGEQLTVDSYFNRVKLAAQQILALIYGKNNPYPQRQEVDWERILQQLEQVRSVTPFTHFLQTQYVGDPENMRFRMYRVRSLATAIIWGALEAVRGTREDGRLFTQERLCTVAGKGVKKKHLTDLLKLQMNGERVIVKLPLLHRKG